MCEDPNFSSVWFQVSKACKGILLYVSDFKELNPHLSQKPVLSLCWKRQTMAQISELEIAFQKQKSIIQPLLDAFILDISSVRFILKIQLTLNLLLFFYPRTRTQCFSFCYFEIVPFSQGWPELPM